MEIEPKKINEFLSIFRKNEFPSKKKIEHLKRVKHVNSEEEKAQALCLCCLEEVHSLMLNQNIRGLGGALQVSAA